MESVAEAVAAGGDGLAAQLAAHLLRPLRNNVVERPWGGVRLREFKGLCPLPDQARLTGLGLGEAFEISACDEDDEARAYPSRIRFEDGTELALPRLLERHCAALLGTEFAARYGCGFPLLPKTLDVKELLSVQGHPEGYTEVYIIIDADPGATIRLGFNRDLEPRGFAARLGRGRELQQRLLEMLGPQVDEHQLQAELQDWFADRLPGAGVAPAALFERCRNAAARRELEALLGELKALYWYVLDAMNELPVTPGDVIYNANPPRIAEAAGRLPSAEVHALGNPERREILALEIRRPGPTLRAWDHVRFPLRRLDVEAAVSALNLRRTEPEEFRVEPAAVPGRPGVLRSVGAPQFEIEHLRPRTGKPVTVPAEPPHCLHVLGSPVSLRTAAGAELGILERGESAIVPIGVGAYELAAAGEGAEVVKVGLPELRQSASRRERGFRSAARVDRRIRSARRAHPDGGASGASSSARRR
ncbi:MAG TPA: hypothetical protein VFY39_02245 [Gammaproteobacteria bacterium]|nr:hypothetical protein [Gammaproteobacteria bacterium]